MYEVIGGISWKEYKLQIKHGKAEKMHVELFTGCKGESISGTLFQAQSGKTF